MGIGPVIRQDKFDKDFFTNAIKETSGMFEEFLTIKRFTGLTGGDDAAGIAATETFVSIPTKASISNMASREINYPNTIYAIGDLQAEFKVAVYGEESNAGDFQAPGRRSDRVVYRNREYKFVGHVERRFLNKRVYWRGVLRQVAKP